MIGSLLIYFFVSLIEENFFNVSLDLFILDKNHPMSLPSFCLDGDAVLKESSDDIKWRHGIPNYSKANSLFEKHKTTDHQPGSLESIVQNIVKNWEKGIYIQFEKTNIL